MSARIAALFSFSLLLGACASESFETATSDTGGTTGDGGVDGAKTDTTAGDTTVGDTTARDTAGGDTSSTDTALDTGKSDTGPLDTGSLDTGVLKDIGVVDGGPGPCTGEGDCRTYSSYCAAKDPCVCLALRVGEKDPFCPGPSASCFVDPCVGKTATCSGGVCVIK